MNRFAILVTVYAAACAALLVASMATDGSKPPKSANQKKPAQQRQQQQDNGELPPTELIMNDPSYCQTLPRKAYRAEICSRPMMDLIYGKVDKWPTNLNDTRKQCDSFMGAERCIRETGRDCAQGLQRTIITTLATSINRVRKRECSDAKMPALMKTFQCAQKHQLLIQKIVANLSDYMYYIEDEIKDSDQSINAVCCMISEVEVEVRSKLRAKCPEEIDLLIRIYHAIIEDVVDIVCRQPRCATVFKGKKIVHKEKPFEIIAVVMRLIMKIAE